MYDGTLAGHWQAIVTMQQLIVLANEDGVVDMTSEAIARRTTIPLKIITAGIDHLAKPDPLSRTPGEEGRRIELLDQHRPWGWRLVNFAKYRALRNMEQKREADRERIAEKRKQISDVAIVSQGVAKVAHTDTYTDTELLFVKFWDSYPNKAAKQDALRAFRKLSLQNGDFERVLKALEIAKQCKQWRRDGGQYIPHAATWLNGKRFDDEVTASPKPYSGP